MECNKWRPNGGRVCNWLQLFSILRFGQRGACSLNGAGQFRGKQAVPHNLQDAHDKVLHTIVSISETSFLHTDYATG